MNLQELQHFIDHTEIPYTERHTGFLEIIRKQHHENINSTLYAYFINSEMESLKGLFVNALVRVINQKREIDFSINDATAQTEVTTTTGRIDLLISDRQNKKCIIIENKIFHHLDNDLQEYWDFIGHISDENKIGVLLTPKATTIPIKMKDKYVNILHSEWIQAIEDAGVPEELPLSHDLYLKDFFNSIKSFSTSYAMDEAAQFYFKNVDAVKKANETMHAAHQFLEGQLQLIATKLGWEQYGNSITWRNFWDEKNHLDTYLTITLQGLLDGKLGFMLILEMNRKDKENASKMEELFKDHPQFNKMKRGESKGMYLHFGYIDYQIKEDELERFADIVLEKIREDFADLTLQIIEHTYPDKDISAWRENFTAEQNNF